MKLKIDLRKSVPENAESYYQEAKKAKHKVTGAKKALKNTQEKIAKLKKKREASVVEQAPPKKKPRVRKWYDKFRWFYSSDNFLVVGGKDATTNDILIKKHLEKHDIVFHADIHGAPFFVIKNPDGGEIPGATLKEAADAAASYSKAWKLGMGSCDVYYVGPDQVSKTAPSGEHIGKGAFMIHGKKQWFRGTRVEVGVGFRVGDEIGVVGGPPDSVKVGSDYFVRIGTGDKKSGELAREIRGFVLRKTKKEDGQRIKRVNLDEIQRLIPGGGGRVLG